MKKKYFADPEKQAVWDEVLAETKRAADQHQDGSWITYLVRDPRGSDKKGRPGLPIYVGQTNDFPKRVFSRFKKCEKLALEKGVDGIERRVSEMLHARVVARYQVIDRQPTRLLSLVSETNMARRAWNNGYELVNRKELQNCGGRLISTRLCSSRSCQFSLTESPRAWDHAPATVKMTTTFGLGWS